MTADESQLTKIFERIPGLRTASPRRLAAYSLPVLAILAILALAAALLWLQPADFAQAQDDAAGSKITAGPTITSSPAGGDTYRADETITVALIFSESVTVTGKPRLRLQVGDQRRWAGYESADGATLSFTYVVTEADRDDDGVSLKKNALDLNGGKIEDADGNRARLRHGKVADQAGHKVNGAPDEPEPPANNEPQFTDDTAARSVNENTAAGENVGAAVTAGDDDGDTLTYALTGADAGAFDFDASTGQIQVKDALDYETKASYAVTVTVHDGKDTAGETDASEDDTIAVTITVFNVDEPGTVALDYDEPQLGTEVTASLSDPDGGVTGETWNWERSADGSQWTAIAGATAAYTPRNEDAGHYLRATASYDDGEGPGKTAMAATVAAVEPPPSVSAGPAIASAPASGDTYRAGETITVTLTYGEPVTVTGKPRLRLKIGDQKRWAGYASADGATLNFTHKVKPDDVDSDGISIGKNQLKLNGGTIVDADGNAANLKHPKLADQAGHKTNGAADEPEPERTPTPTPEPQPQREANNEPQFPADTAARSVNENTAAGTNVGAAVTATDDDNDTLTYALTGADAGFFDFDTASGQITVKAALNYEATASYSVTVTVHDGKNAAGETDASEDDTIAITISVLNVDEAGVLSLLTENNAFEVGQEIRATLLDPDGGVNGLTWIWERSADGNAWVAMAGVASDTYTVTGDDAGRYLRATALYTDGEGSGKRARATSGPVAAELKPVPPQQPQNAPDVRHECLTGPDPSCVAVDIPVWQATLIVDNYRGLRGCHNGWPDMDNCSGEGAVLSNYSFTYRGQGYKVQALELRPSYLYVEISSDGSHHRDTVTRNLSSLILQFGDVKRRIGDSSPLGGGFSVDPGGTRWRDGQRVSLSLVDPTVAFPPEPPTDLTATAGTGSITLQWTDPSRDPAHNRYEYRYTMVGVSGWSSQRRINNPTKSGNSVSFTVGGLKNDLKYTFQVRTVGKYAGGATGWSGSASATPVPDTSLPPIRCETPAENGWRCAIQKDSKLVPDGLEVGKAFRLMFITSGGIKARSSDILTYNAHVQQAARSNDAHDELLPMASHFRALLSTADVAARVNTWTRASDRGASGPIYWLNGQKVADNYNDLLDGGWDTGADGKWPTKEDGTDITDTNRRVWTGTTNMGAPSSGNQMGNSSVAFGRPNLEGEEFTVTSSPHSGLEVGDRHYSLYAISPVMVVIPSSYRNPPRQEVMAKVDGEPRIYLELSGEVLSEEHRPSRVSGQDRSLPLSRAYVTARLDATTNHDLVVTLDAPPAGAGYTLTHRRFLIFAGSMGNTNAPPHHLGGPLKPSVQVNVIDDNIYNDGRVHTISGKVKAYLADSVYDLRNGVKGCPEPKEPYEAWIDDDGNTISDAAYNMKSEEEKKKYERGMVFDECGTSGVTDDPSTYKALTALSGNDAPTLLGPEPVKFVVRDNDRAPTVMLKVDPNPIREGATGSLTAHIWPLTKFETVVTLDDPPPGVEFSAATLTIPAGASVSSSSVTVTAADNDRKAPPDNRYAQALYDSRVVLSATAFNLEFMGRPFYVDPLEVVIIDND